MSDELELHCGNAGDSVRFSRYRNEFHIAINEPWAGNTETGFGIYSSITLSKEQALELVAWISKKWKP